ncbi:MAG: contractile injection system protein, VgrG/Pvc8 family [Pigmentiphaga sp.]
MKPTFRITHDSQDITSKIADRLLSLRVTDEAGITSDQFDLAVDNRDGAIAIPETGAVLQVAMGYEGMPLYDMGRFTIDEVESSGMPRTLSLRGKAADMKASLKSQKKRDWDKTTLGKIVDTIAGEHGMEAKVAEKYRDIEITHLDQTYESDMNILTRLADQYGAVMKPAGGFLLFVERGVGVNADGQPLPTLPISIEDALYWRASIHERQFYARVGAHWRDKRKSAVAYVYAGSGDPVMYVRHPHKSESDALAAAESKLRQLSRGRTSLSITLRGQPVLCAEMPILVSLADAIADGEWIIVRAEHRFDGAGLTSSIEAQRRDDIEADSNERAQANEPTQE